MPMRNCASDGRVGAAPTCSQPSVNFCITVTQEPIEDVLQLQRLHKVGVRSITFRSWSSTLAFYHLDWNRIGPLESRSVVFRFPGSRNFFWRGLVTGFEV